MINEWVEIIKKLQYLRGPCAARGGRGSREYRDVEGVGSQTEEV
jgi:hypothetical protein